MRSNIFANYPKMCFEIAALWELKGQYHFVTSGCNEYTYNIIRVNLIFHCSRGLTGNFLVSGWYNSHLVWGWEGGISSPFPKWRSLTLQKSVIFKINVNKYLMNSIMGPGRVKGHFESAWIRFSSKTVGTNANCPAWWRHGSFQNKLIYPTTFPVVSYTVK